MATTKIKWDDSTEIIQWDSNTYQWDDVAVLIAAAAVASAGGGGDFADVTRDWSKEDKKKLIKIVCKVNGIKYKDEKWKESTAKVNASQIKIAVSKVLGIEIDI